MTPRNLPAPPLIPSDLERYSRDWQERLRAIADQFGADFPVYVVITKCDKIPFFSDFFRRLPESEVNQVLGCTLPVRDSQAARSDEVFVEAEAKRLTASFRPLYHALARRRLTQLAHEPNPAQRPGVYEFPRELKRIRSPLVQFLTDVFRPNSLGPSLMLRGYYLTGRARNRSRTCQASRRCRDAVDRRLRWRPHGCFAAVTPRRCSRATTLRKRPVPAAGKPLHALDIRRRSVPPRDTSGPASSSTACPFRWRTASTDIARWPSRAVCGLCALLCLAFVVSWWNNRSLLSDIGAVASSQTDPEGKGDIAPGLAGSGGPPRSGGRGCKVACRWRFHWGLYTGNGYSSKRREPHISANSIGFF